MEAIVRNEPHLSGIDRVTITVETYTPPKPPPHPTEEELARVPERFRCFVCLRMRGRKKFAAFVGSEMVCRICYPYIDEQDITPPPNHIMATKHNRVPLVIDVWTGLEEEIEEGDL